jgi:hypothetical protein
LLQRAPATSLCVSQLSLRITGSTWWEEQKGGERSRAGSLSQSWGIASGLRHLTATVRRRERGFQRSDMLVCWTPVSVFQISNASGFQIGADLIRIRIRSHVKTQVVLKCTVLRNIWSINPDWLGIGSSSRDTYRATCRWRTVAKVDELQRWYTCFLFLPKHGTLEHLAGIQRRKVVAGDVCCGVSDNA